MERGTVTGAEFESRSGGVVSHRQIGMVLAASLAVLPPGAGGVHAQGGVPARSGYTFPQKIGIAELVNVEDFEPKTPGLGQVGQYTFQGWRMSIYVYDKKRTDLAEAPNAAQSRPELDLSVVDVLEAKKLGHYARVDEGTPFSMPPLGTPPVFLCRTFIMQLAPKSGGQSQAPYESYLCVTTLRKKYVKVRLSSTTSPGDQATVFTPVAAVLELTGRVLQR